MARRRIEPDSALGRVLRDAAITLVDVGARGEVRPELMTIAACARLVACEPDQAEAAGLRERLLAAAPWTGVDVITEALWEQAGEVALHITRSPGLSSLRRPDPLVTGRYAVADAFVVERTVTVPAVTLDEAARRHGFEDAAFVKLDTQGTELEILRSGDDLVRASVAGVYLETEFQPLYEGQARFADVDAHLRDRGFELFDLHRSSLRRAGHDPELYSRRQVTWAHCLYLRAQDDVLRRGGAWPGRLLALALAYEHHDLALEVARGAGMGEDVLADICALATAETRRRLKRSPDDARALLAASAKDPRR